MKSSGSGCGNLRNRSNAKKILLLSMHLLRLINKLRRLDSYTLWKLNMYLRWKFTLQVMECSRDMVRKCTNRLSPSSNNKWAIPIVEHSKGLVNKCMTMLCLFNSSNSKFHSLIDLSWNLTICLLMYRLQEDFFNRVIRLCPPKLSIKEKCRQCLPQGDNNCLPMQGIQNSPSRGHLLRSRSFNHLWVSISIRLTKTTTFLKK